MRQLRTCPVTGRVVLINDAWLDAPPVEAPAAAPAASAQVVGTRGGCAARPCATPWLGVEGSVEMHRHEGRLWREAVGAHELLLGGTTAEALALAQDRIADLRGDTRLRGFHLAWRGAWQLYALPFEPVPGAPEAWRDAERRSGERVIGAVDGAVAILAWAPRVPFETWVLPAWGRGGFEEAEVGPVAALLDRVVERLARALPGAELDRVVVDGAPWRVEVLPRLGRPALSEGFDLPAHGTFPEAAAAYLRIVEGA